MKLFLTLAVTLAFFSACSDNNAGTSSNTTNSIASIQILDNQGQATPGKIQIFGKTHSKLNPQETFEFESDTNGIVDFEKDYPNAHKNLPQEFNLQLISEENPDQILWIDTLSNLDNLDTLRLDSAVYLSGDLDQLNIEADSAWVIIEGTDYYSTLNNQKRFTFENFPEGEFKLQVIVWENQSSSVLEDYQIDIFKENQHFSLQEGGDFFKD